MPIPKPHGEKSQQTFISHCMADSVMNKEYPDQKQRAAICYSQWKRAKHRKKAKGSKGNPTWDEQETSIATIIPPIL